MNRAIRGAAVYRLQAVADQVMAHRPHMAMGLIIQILLRVQAAAARVVAAAALEVVLQEDREEMEVVR